MSASRSVRPANPVSAATPVRVLRPLLLAAALTAAVAAGAPEGAGEFQVDWSTVDGGGGLAAAGDLSLLGTIGQPDAGGPAVSGDWSLVGGFLVGGSGAVVPDCPPDLDGSQVVDFGDLLAVLAAFGPCDGCPEDLDGNGFADFNDVLGVLSSWGPCD